MKARKFELKRLLQEAQTEESGQDPHWTKVEEAILLSPFSRSELLYGFLYPGAWVALILVAGIMRFWDLGARTMHDGEAKIAKFAWEILADGSVVYDPSLHGPLQLQAIAALFFLFGDNEAIARLVHAFSGTVLVALPYLLRSRLGEIGAFFTALMIAVSPSLLYFSRFAGPDILVATFSLGIIVAVWRYFDEFENLNMHTHNVAAKVPVRYLYFIAAILALAVASKETAFVFIFFLCVYLMLAIACRNLAAAGKPQGLDVAVSEPGGILRTAGQLFVSGLMLREYSKEYSMLVYLATLTLSLGAAAFCFLHFGKFFPGTETAYSDSGAGGSVATPATSAMVSIVVAASLSIAAIGYGLRWNLKVWLIASAIFYSLYCIGFLIVLASSEGLHPGIWRLPAYWFDRLTVSGGDQPWFYYILISLVYEYLPLTFGVVATVHYFRRRDSFALFLVFWSWAAFLVYSLSAEKFPWLLVNIALPLILLSGKFLNDIVEIRGFRHPASIGLIAVASLLFVLTARTAYQASFRFGDIPVELLVERQSSKGFHALARATRKKHDLLVAVDGTGAFHWPWAWYLRGMSEILYVYCGAEKEQLPTNVEVVFVNEVVVIASGEAGFGTAYDQELIMPHRSGFPESIYKELTFSEFAAAMAKAATWWRLADYFLNRNIRSESEVCIPSAGEFSCLGSEYTVVYNKSDTGDPRIPCSF